MTFNIRDGGTWKTASPYVRDGGVWKQPEVYVRDGGTWKLVHSPVSVSVSPSSRSWSAFADNYTFPACTVSVSGGTATSYTWGFTDQFGGTWAISSGQNTVSAAARVTAVSSMATATLYCDVVVNGQTYRVNVPHDYSNLNGG